MSTAVAAPATSAIAAPAATAAVAAPAADRLTKKQLTADHPTWCPGCGDFAVLAAFYKVLEKLQYPQEKIVVVAGIGCSSAGVAPPARSGRPATASAPKVTKSARRTCATSTRCPTAWINCS